MRDELASGAVSFLTNKIFSGIDREFLAKAEGLFKREAISAQEVIFREGDPGDVMFLIDTGHVKITKKGRGGGNEVLSTLTNDDFFGEMAVIDEEPRSATAISVEACVLWKIDRHDFQTLIVCRYPDIAMNLIKIITARIRSLDRLFVAEMLKSERLSLVGQMAGSIVHDFRNPMTAIKSAGQILQINKKPETIDRMAEIIVSQVDKMELMTRELLDYCRGECRYEMQPVSIEKLLRTIEEESREPLARKKVSLTVQVEPMPSLMADPHALERVLVNLMNNSADAMPQGGNITFRAQFETDRIELMVADTGKGMGPEILSQIFEPFFTQGKKKGTGLGLAIVKRIIEAHGGTIRVESEPGLGTTFTIQLPLVTAPASDAPLKTA
ncbi:MAG: ATP-binding protein [Verrucomicrobiae bacterium]|nr:ATP-binding protein [Verrucomicrobiae bacterium]